MNMDMKIEAATVESALDAKWGTLDAAEVAETAAAEAAVPRAEVAETAAAEAARVALWAGWVALDEARVALDALWDAVRVALDAAWDASRDAKVAEAEARDAAEAAEAEKAATDASAESIITLAVSKQERNSK
ncbi:MAG: hypothetical protein EBX50_12655 [Chitinophagia bacterium]|nr:hypothetical protein [Chitinophagia bacterium]